MSTTSSSTNQNENQSNNNTSNERIRKREDPTVSKLRFDWQIFISRMIHLSSTCKAADSSSSNPNNNNNTATVQQNIASKAKEVIDKQNELKKSIGRMESIIKGREEEMKGLVLDRGSAGVAGRKRRKCQLQKEQESVGDAVNFFLDK